MCLFVGLILIWSLWRTRVFVCWSDLDMESMEDICVRLLV